MVGLGKRQPEWRTRRAGALPHLDVCQAAQQVAAQQAFRQRLGVLAAAVGQLTVLPYRLRISPCACGRMPAV